MSFDFNDVGDYSYAGKPVMDFSSRLECPHCGYIVDESGYIGKEGGLSGEGTCYCPHCGFRYYSKSEYSDGSKSGYWVRDKNDTHCSECGDVILRKVENKYDPSITNDFHRGIEVSIRYCRVCGAIMFDNIEVLNEYRAAHNQKLKSYTGSSSQLKSLREAKQFLRFIGKVAAIILAVIVVLGVLGFFVE